MPLILPLNLQPKPSQRDGAWKKLTAFEADLHGSKAPLFLDLDVVIVGSWTAFTSRGRVPHHPRLPALAL